MRLIVKKFFRFICFGAVLCALVIPAAFSAPLSGKVFVNETNDTAAKAKSVALSGARRQILYNVVSQYSDKSALSELIKGASDEDLMNLISETEVSNEQIASDTYSANIQMNIDNEAVKQWLNNNNIQNWIPSTEVSEKFVASIVVLNGISDWAELKRIAREENIDIDTQSITGNQIIVKIPLNLRGRFTAAVRGAGWKYSDNDGVLHIWK
jgi:hypothetical protein